MDVPICVVKNNTFDGFMAVGYGIHEVVGWCETWISDGLVLKLDSIRQSRKSVSRLHWRLERAVD
jgi:hypothetical protein